MSESTELRLPDHFLIDDDHKQRIAGTPRGGLPLSSAPRYTIYRLVSELRPASILEIGTQSGASAVAMGHAQRNANMPIDVTCIDPFLPTGDNDGLKTLNEWYTNLSENALLPDVQLYVSTSERVLPVLDRTFDFVFIDGSHAYEHVRLDWQLALAALKPGGLIIGHDYVYYEPVRSASDEVISKYGLPFGINEIQRNHRGDLCGWVAAERPADFDTAVEFDTLPERENTPVPKRSWFGRK